MKKLLAIFLIWSTAYGQTTPLSFTRLSTDYARPHAGAQQWNGSPWDNVNDPYIPSGVSVAPEWMRRFLWSADFEDITQGSYSFTAFDTWVNSVIDAGQTASFGIMPMCTGCINRAFTYPTYLHTLMQAETTNSKDWFDAADGIWVPNWNSPNYQARWKALIVAVATHIASGTHSGKNYRDVIDYVDIRGYGETGEWNTYPWFGTEPTGRIATAASLDSIISAVGQNFPNNQLVQCFGVMDPGNASLTPPATSTYFLNYTNNFGHIGWRRDNMGDPGFDAALDSRAGILTQWAFAPIGGEPNNDANDVPYGDVPREVTKYHMSYFGNGNWATVNASNAPFVANARQASQNSAARPTLDSGAVTANPTTGGTFNITLYHKNIGPAPVYYNKWKIIYELRRTSDQVVMWRDTSKFKLRLFLPQQSDSIFVDNFLLTGVTASTCDLHIWIKDSVGYRPAMPLAITGRQSDGSYILKAGLVITSSTTPTANAGPDQSLPNGTTTVSLSGSLSSGSITSYLWTNISGPNTPTITTATTVNTTVTGLVQGTYVFQLAVNGGSSGSLIDQVTVVVNPPAPPTANAGPDQILTAPTSTATLNGTGSTGTITSYLWTNVSGPNTPTITSNATSITGVTGLIPGSYVFKLSLNGGVVSDNIGILVQPLLAPVVNIFTTQTPVSGINNDGQAIEVGVKFRSSTSGFITGVRFYKKAGQTGTHIGELYLYDGTRLGQATYTGETASGWQTVMFASPIPITHDTLYVASTLMPDGNYLDDDGFFITQYANSPLIVLPAPANGIYIYTGTPAMPVNNCGGCNGPNYWIDVLFTQFQATTCPCHPRTIGASTRIIGH